MIIKIMAASILALVLGLGAAGVINITHPQDIAVQAETVEVGQEGFEYEQSFEYGEQNGDWEPVQTQTRQRTHMRELQDGECTGDPQELRLNRAEKLNLMRQEQRNRRDGSCFGGGLGQGLGNQNN